jgi:endonuclease III
VTPAAPLDAPNATPRRARAIHARLARRFGELAPPRSVDPLDELILTVLSQHTSDLNADRAFADLRRPFPRG